MALSIFTNASSMASNTALNKANRSLTTAMQRLGTGKRVNSSADDAAGLQIATRLEAQSRGISVAKRNISDATALLQTAEGAFSEVTNIMLRMKDLATQSANDTNGTSDRTALQKEFLQLGQELKNIMDNTTFAGEKLFVANTGKMAVAAGITFQIGATSSESFKFDGTKELKDVQDVVAEMVGATPAVNLTDLAKSQDAMTKLNSSLNTIGALRAVIGATVNRLEHTSNNLSNIQDNTRVAVGNIMDADFAEESSNMARNSLLSQSSMTMLKQANASNNIIMSLLQ